jgi:predicted MFS family arabinose efflux permease
MSLALRALLITLAIQAFVSLTAVAVPALAPVVAADAGVPTALLGLFVAMLYLSSMFSGLISAALIDRHGPIRVSQAAVVLGALGIAAATGPLPLLAVAALLLGAAYGSVTPASSHILIRTAPRDRVALTFSLKQTGVPLGAGLAGAMLPSLALALGWRVSFASVALLGLLIALLAQSVRPAFDNDLHPRRRVSPGAIVEPLRAYLGDPAMRELGRVGVSYAFTQTSLMSFLVAFLDAEAGLTLIAAGLALTVLNAGAVGGRIAFGTLADRWTAPKRLLGWLGIVSGACAFTMTLVDPSWPRPLLLALCAGYGAVAVGWNGVQLSEVARAAPPGKAGQATAANMFVTFSGVLIGPSLFGAIAGAAGTYRPGFVLLGVVSLANGLALAWKYRGASRLGSAPPR